jgi:hypothetical protein
MKRVTLMFALIAVTFLACNNAGDKPNGQGKTTDTTALRPVVTNSRGKAESSIKDVLNGYLDIKNALANDNSEDAAKGGQKVLDAIGKTDQSSFTEKQKKDYLDVADDIKENAEHINKSSGKIAHQREHFDMLSQDIYKLAKAFNTGEKLYQDFCPMYNDSKGAAWISETKEIKNPYLGKEMSECGEVKEEIK